MNAQRELRIGFIALSDCAPLVIAKERGFFRRHGLRVQLQREPSWANIRDKLVAGVLDAAQALAPMTLATTLGLDGLSMPLVAPMSLGTGGNAITVSTDLFRRMLEVAPEGALERPARADALAAVIDEDRREGRPRLRFGVVFPFSAHNYELRYWMAAAGIDPSRDLEIRVVPPVRMPESLQSGDIDGFCVGEPWNHLAVDQGVGRSLVSKYEIWNNSPEKVLAVTEPWADANPGPLRAMLRALVEAGAWLDGGNRREAVHVIAGESFVDAPVPIVAGSMEGSLQLDRSRAAPVPDFHLFHRYAASFPWTSHAAWFLSQMIRWGQIEKPIDVRDVAGRVYRPDLYREAAEELGEPFPEVDRKIEGVHGAPWTLEEASAPLAMGPDRFLDGRVFRDDDLIGYLEHTEISALSVRLDDLALMNE